MQASHRSSAADSDAIRRELKQWERYAIRRLPLKQAGQAPDHPFVVEAVPEAIAFEISARLLAAESVEEVRAVFREIDAGGCASADVQ